MTTGTARLIALFVLAGIPACGGGGDSGVNGPPSTPVVTTVAISPNPVTVFMGDTIQLTATAKDQNGNAMPGKRVTWASNLAAVATVDSLGLVVTKTSGTATIAATIEGKTGSVALTSTGPGTTGAVTGSATIGTTGGSVQATLPGGGTMNLTVPSGALQTSVPITLEPLVPPPGALASFHLTPAGVRFNKDATLVIKLSAGAKVRPTSTLVFEQAGQRIPVPGVANLADGTLTISLSALGLSDSSTFGVSSRTRALPSHGAAGSATGTVSNAELDVLFNLALVGLDQLVASGTIAAAENLHQVMETITTLNIASATEPVFTQIRTQWASTVCASANFAFNALSSFGFVSDYRGLERVMVAVIHWHRVAKEMDTYLRQTVGLPVTCFNSLPDPNTRIHTKVTTLEPSIIADLNAFDVEPSPRDSAFFRDRLKPLIDLGASLAFLGNPADGQILQNIVRDQLVRLRTLGYSRCRAGTKQDIQGTLARNAAVVPLPGLTLGDLQEDIENCGMSIQWAALDSVGISVSSGTLGGGFSPGQVTASASTTLFGDGQLRLRGGQLQALLCPAPASANNEQLEIVAGRNSQSLTRVAVVSPSNANTYLAVSPLLIDTDTLRTVAGLGPTDVGTVTIVVRRIGGLCSGRLALASHSTLATIQLTLENDPVMYFKNFNAGPTGTEWSTTQTATSPSGQRFLGELGNSSTTLTIDSLRGHTRVVLEFDIYIIDSWNGNGGQGSAAAPDIIEVSVVGGQVLKKTTFSNKPSDVQAYPGNYPGSSFAAGTGALGKGTLGYPPDSDHFGDSSYRLRLTFDHTGGSIAIRFASQQTSGQNERWGIDNVRLSRTP